MCGRTALSASPEELREIFELDELPVVAPHYNVPPSQPVHVVRAAADGASRKLEAVRWGLVPYWAKDPKIGGKLALARTETVVTAPAFREAVRRRRCLVAIDGFYEWQRDGKKSHPFAVRRDDGKPFALAGVWERWISKDDGEVLESCAIITQPARSPVDLVHERMPLVLPKGDWAGWLDPRITGADAIAPLLAPRDPALVAYEVAPHVNDPRHDDVSCFARVERPQQVLFARVPSKPRDPNG
jgi:putative SOS response-associated peptidase YedK